MIDDFLRGQKEETPQQQPELSKYYKQTLMIVPVVTA
jgi:hypothetical protein